MEEIRDDDRDTAQPDPPKDGEASSGRERIAAEEYMDGVKARAKERSGRRLTGDDVAAGMAARREARARRRESRRAKGGDGGRRILRTSAVVGAGLAMVIAVGGLGAAQDAHTTAMSGLSADLRNAEASLRAAERAAEEAGSPEELAAQGVAQAAEADAAAQAVAQKQQEINALMRAAALEGNDGAGGLAPSYVASTDLRIAIGDLFEEEDLALGEDAMISTDMASNATTTDPRVVWYAMAGDDGATADPSLYGWTVEGITPTRAAGTFNVTWAARVTATGEVLAWTTASYSADTGLFSDFTKGLTTVGARQALGGAR